MVDKGTHIQIYERYRLIKKLKEYTTLSNWKMQVFSDFKFGPLYIQNDLLPRVRFFAAQYSKANSKLSLNLWNIRTFDILIRFTLRWQRLLRIRCQCTRDYSLYELVYIAANVPSSSGQVKDLYQNLFDSKHEVPPYAPVHIPVWSGKKGPKNKTNLRKVFKCSLNTVQKQFKCELQQISVL